MFTCSYLSNCIQKISFTTCNGIIRKGDRLIYNPTFCTRRKWWLIVFINSLLHKKWKSNFFSSNYSIKLDSVKKTPDFVKKQMLNASKRKRSKRTEVNAIQTSNKSEKDVVKFITDQNKHFAYCHIPKAASSTWMVTIAQINKLTSNATELMQFVENGSLHDTMWKRYGFFEDNVPESAFKFTFIRHPFERIVSTVTESHFIMKHQPTFKKSQVVSYFWRTR